MKTNVTLLLMILLLGINLTALSQENVNPFDKKKKTQTTENPETPVQDPVIIDQDMHKNNFNAPENNSYNSIPVLSRPDSQSTTTLQVAEKFSPDGRLIFFKGQISDKTYGEKDNESIQAACHSYMAKIKDKMQIDEPAEEFSVMTIEQDELGQEHIKMQQYYKGVKVYGGQVYLHGSDAKINLFNGTFYPTPQIEELTPSISGDSATRVALNDMNEVTIVKKLSDLEKTILNYNQPDRELVIYHSEKDTESERLAWHLTVRPNFIERWEYFVDAMTGVIIHKYDNTIKDGPATSQAIDLNGETRTIHTYEVDGNYFMIDASRQMFNPNQSNLPNEPVGVVWTLDANNSSVVDITVSQVVSPDNSWSHPTTVSAHANSSATYEYYLNTHNRVSLNDEGNSIVSVVNVTDPNGNSMENAFWNGAAAFYGNGGQNFKPLAGALDVTAHELGHGVISNSANLEYQDESGAINETYADISGSMVDRDDWLIGEDIIQPNNPAFPTGAMRSMADPHNGGSSFNDPCYNAAHVSEMYIGEEDNGGVHLNCGIGNYAFYLFATATSKETAEQVFFRALFHYLTMSSQFIDFRIAVVQSAADLYGDDSAEVDAAKNAFDQVGIEDGTGGGHTWEIEINPGMDYILFQSLVAGDQNSLYLCNTDGSNFSPISTTPVKSKPSIVDDASVAVFVSEASQMHAIEMQSAEEYLLQDQQIWDNVAVSKDGTKLAAITTEIDSAIWVYDFALQQWAKFHLYNPTDGYGGVVINNVLYADAIEWDYSGEYLIYDAYNVMENQSGQSIDYWDVGFLHVWDNSTNSWGTGDIGKLFSTLPEGVSIGNPSFSKNSPYILTFDYYDAYNQEAYVLASNIETGETGAVFQNATLGFPNYSKLDDKIVFNAVDSEGNPVIAAVDLQDNKLLPSGEPYALIANGGYPVWFAQGQRNFSSIDENGKDDHYFTIFPNPCSDHINLKLEEKNAGELVVEIYNITGSLLERKSVDYSGGSSRIDVSHLDLGLYFARISGDEITGTARFYKN